MKSNAPGSPPAHRLPVLTEVVELADPPEVRAAVEQDAEVPARTRPSLVAETPPLQAEPAAPPPMSEAPSPPEWLKRRPGEAAVELPLPAMAPQTPLPSDFSGSWWSRDEGPAVLPSPPPVPLHIPAPLVAQARVEPVSEDEVVRRVVTGLEEQLDLMFDHRIQEAVAPALARAADSLIADLRDQMVSVLHDMVSRAVAIEMARQRRDGGTI